MKKFFLAATTALLALTSCQQSSQKVTPVIPSDPEIEKKVEATLSKMTLEEKIGQMTEVVLDIFGAPDENGKFKIDEPRMTELFAKYKVGSILNAPMTSAPTAAEWEEYQEIIQRISMEQIGIPCIYGLDQNHGTTYTSDGTLFPQNINVAASFNREIARKAAEITAYETRASNCPWTYSPTMDLARDPRWPRVWEDYGEDCYLSGQMASAAVKGFQGEDPNHVDKYHVSVSCKHYMGYGVPISGKDRTPSSIAAADLREKHFAPFLECFRAGALNIMVNSGNNNGLPFHANKELLTGWLKEELGWDGMIVTDWADINNLYTRDKVAKDKKEAIKMAINAGIDMAMEPYSLDFCDILKELVEEGSVPMSRIDDAARRVIRMKYRLGLFDNPTYKLADYPKFGSDEHAQVSRESAEETMILLKNENDILPLTKGKRILLTGPNANSIRCINGGWSFTWQGSNEPKFVDRYNTIYEAMCNKFGASNVILEQGVTYDDKGQYWAENEPEISKAVAAASRADIIVACIGENSYTETPGNLSDLALSENQRNLVKALAKTGKPIVLLLNEGRPRLIADIEPLAKAVVDMLIPGPYGGDAIANLLAGDANFSARLPYTYPRESASLITYDFKPCAQMETMEGAYDYNAVVSVQWAFGFGKSYTTFEYSNLKLEKTNFKDGDNLTFSVDVKNTGKVAGKEAVLLFVSDLVASCTPDNRRLRQFDKISLEPGETKTVSLTIKASDLAFVDYYGKWILEEGDFKAQIGNQTLTFACTETQKYDTPNK